MEYFEYLGYQIALYKKSNNKNIYFRIQQDGSIKVTCPYHIRKDDIYKYLANFIKKLNDKYDIDNLDKIGYHEGSLVYILAKPYPLRIVLHDKKRGYVSIKDDYLYVYTNKNDPESIKKLIDLYLKKMATSFFNERFFILVKQFEEIDFIPILKIRTMTSRFGVCYYKKNMISLSTLLIHYDLDCIDYVIFHELAHFIHPNHSKKFHNLVEKYVPNYKVTIKKLQNRL